MTQQRHELTGQDVERDAAKGDERSKALFDFVEADSAQLDCWAGRRIGSRACGGQSERSAFYQVT
jgi:hypothetical protein